jgi:hypothetical protein
MNIESNRQASSNGTAIFAALAFLVVAILVIVAPGIVPADAAHAGVLLIGP